MIISISFTIDLTLFFVIIAFLLLFAALQTQLQLCLVPSRLQVVPWVIRAGNDGKVRGGQTPLSLLPSRHPLR